jgi:hypothetical protein
MLNLGLPWSWGEYPNPKGIVSISLMSWVSPVLRSFRNSGVTWGFTNLAVASVKIFDLDETREVEIVLPGSKRLAGLKMLHSAISEGFVPVGRRALGFPVLDTPTTDKSSLPPRSSVQNAKRAFVCPKSLVA